MPQAQGNSQLHASLSNQSKRAFSLRQQAAYDPLIPTSEAGLCVVRRGTGIRDV